jgi:quinate dehydrogenase (quinone)
MPAFDRGVLTEADMWGITPVDQMACRLAFRGLRYEGPFTPPSLQGTLLHPGVGGGMNWGSVAVDEVNHLAVVNVIHLPMTVTLIPREQVTAEGTFGMGGLQAGTPYAALTLPFFSPLFAPCLSPPFGEMAVVNLSTGELVWRRPVGTARDLGPLGLKSHLSLPMGVFIRGGTLVTAGGLIFTAGVADHRLRAMDVLTGDELWTVDVPTSAEATPMSYVSPASGRQTVLVTLPDSGELTLAHGDSSSAGPPSGSGGYVIAYRLAED